MTNPTPREIQLVEAALKAARKFIEPQAKFERGYGAALVAKNEAAIIINEIDAAIVASVPQEQAGELLPCPFCGGKAEHHDIGNSYTKSRGTKIWCAECRFSKTVKAIQQSLDWTRSHAIAAWNRRAALSAQEQVEPTDAVAIPSEWLKPNAIVPVTAETVGILLRALLSANQGK
ncbi:MAG TPA: Lar family restriction alleviation protein [Dongiaceae bacterium]|nr:Lar family restriction alleviation protein [Dongiaceae bacterium]